MFQVENECVQPGQTITTTGSYVPPTTTGSTLDWDKWKKQLGELRETSPKVCPTCGRCPTCGHNPGYVPYYPYYPYNPWYSGITYTCKDNTQVK